MGVRETLQKMPALFIGLAVLFIAVALYISFQTLSGPEMPEAPTRGYYTVDDGKTYFADDLSNVPPFKTADGKEAVAVMVVSCNGGKDPFVSYLWRYTPEGKRALAAGKREMELEFMREVKKPGQKEWIKTADEMRASDIQTIDCPPDSKFAQLHP